uniref:Uncharacterized protein n=1 Tax=Moniliophthora roreri TaxID=221103 RepID=A0A0W0GC26_MONRR
MKMPALRFPNAGGRVLGKAPGHENNVFDNQSATALSLRLLLIAAGYRNHEVAPILVLVHTHSTGSFQHYGNMHLKSIFKRKSVSERTVQSERTVLNDSSNESFKQPRRSGSTISSKSAKLLYKGSTPLKPSDISLPLTVDTTSIPSGSMCSTSGDYLLDKDCLSRQPSPAPFLLNKDILDQFPAPPRHHRENLPVVRPLNIQKKHAGQSQEDLLPPVTSKMESLLKAQREERMREGGRPPSSRTTSDASYNHQVYSRPAAARTQASIGSSTNYFIRRPIRRTSTSGSNVALKQGPAAQRPIIRRQYSSTDLYSRFRRPTPDVPQDVDFVAEDCTVKKGRVTFPSVPTAQKLHYGPPAEYDEKGVLRPGVLQDRVHRYLRNLSQVHLVVEAFP